MFLRRLEARFPFLPRWHIKIFNIPQPPHKQRFPLTEDILMLRKQDFWSTAYGPCRPGWMGYVGFGLFLPASCPHPAQASCSLPWSGQRLGLPAFTSALFWSILHAPYWLCKEACCIMLLPHFQWLLLHLESKTLSDLLALVSLASLPLCPVIHTFPPQGLCTSSSLCHRMLFPQMSTGLKPSFSAG